MGRGMSIEVLQARLRSTRGEGKNFLYPEIFLKESFTKPGWTLPAAPTLEGVVALALATAKWLDDGRGQTFIADSKEMPYQPNGPWNFSAAVHQRHGLVKED